jgi:hypothetical protein
MAWRHWHSRPEELEADRALNLPAKLPLGLGLAEPSNSTSERGNYKTIKVMMGALSLIIDYAEVNAEKKAMIVLK